MFCSINTTEYKTKSLQSEEYAIWVLVTGMSVLVLLPNFFGDNSKMYLQITEDNR